ncbi:MAG: alanine dehydrogenase [Bacteroidales bacterium]|nr:alanine dehydrogenase [Bacteroidales bacterium]
MDVSMWYSKESSSFSPQEELLELHKKANRITIGIPAEMDEWEYRTPLTPQAVHILTTQGVSVYKEKNAGKKAKYSDLEYSEAGARICSSKEEVFQCDILVKIGCISESEVALLHERQVVLSSVSLQQFSKDVLLDMTRKKITALGYEFVHDEHYNYPILRSMNELVGSLSIIVAAECLSNVEYGKGVLLGGETGVSPTEVVILGANTAGEFAARAALGFGASVKIFDSSIQRLMAIQQTLSQRLFTSTYHETVFRKALLSADVVIGATQLESDDRFIVSDELVQSMKAGTVVVDLCMNQGGCFETSRPTNLGNPLFVKHNVIHYCVPNITSKTARTASIALSNILLPMIKSISEYGSFSLFLKQNYVARQGVYVFNGIVSNATVANYFGVGYKNIDLLSAAF